MLLALLLAFLTSCTNVYFDQPQPKNGENLKFVPKELRGKWVDKLDTIYQNMENKNHLKDWVQINGMKHIDCFMTN